MAKHFIKTDEELSEVVCAATTYLKEWHIFTTIFTLVFGNADDTETSRHLDKQDSDDESDEKGRIDPSSPLRVFNYIHLNNHIVPQDVIQLFSTVINKMGTPREKTIGAFLKANLTLH